MKLFFTLFISFSLFGCASYFKRKECEKTNWHQHGHQVAMRGQRLDADDFIRQCQNVEGKIGYQDADIGFKEGMSKYCTLDSAYETGKNGQKFNFDLCDGLSLKAMQQKHKEGLRLYCSKDNGYPVGASGVVYEKLCPADLEPAFVTEYRRGRKVYLAEIIRQKEQQIVEVDQEFHRLQQEKMWKQNELLQLDYRKSIELRRAANEPARAQVDSLFQRQRQDLEWALRGIESRIQDQHNQRASLREDIRKMQAELVAL